MEKLKIFGEADQNTIEQIQNCLDAGDGFKAVLCADNHLGYSQPIGGTVAYENYISPSGVGYDIGCGNKAVKTNVLAQDVDISKLMDAIFTQISFGMGRDNKEKIEHPVLEKIAKADFAPQRKLFDLASAQIGTVGSGNHFVDIFKDEEGFLWVGVHFGSRGFGHKTASGFMALAQGLAFDARAKDGEMMSPPVLFKTESAIGQDYISAMQLAGEYAYAGRDIVVEKVLEILGAKSVKEVHNHHNFAWLEEHFGKKLWVVRKGCTPAFAGQESFVGANMRDNSVILEGIDSTESREGLFSTVHGAGRVLSRNQAKKQIDYKAVPRELYEKGIVLKGGDADEAPAAYKNLEQVLEAHKNTVKIIHRLQPLGVAMAGKDVFDPYKD